MQHSQEISVELQTISPVLAGAEKLYAFEIPAGYFDTVEQVVKAMLAVPFGVKTPFIIPAGYFETFPEKIRLLALQQENEELREIAPFLHSLGKKTAFAVPAGYFSKPLPVPIEEKAKGKVVPFKGYKRWIQYAAAVMLGGVLVSGAFLFTDSKDYIRNTGDNAMQQSKAVGVNDEARNNPSQEYIAPAVKHPVIAKKAEMLSDDELQNYLEENTPAEQVQMTDDSLEETVGI